MFFDLDVRINCGQVNNCVPVNAEEDSLNSPPKELPASMSNFESHGNKVRNYHKLNIFALLRVFERN